MLPKFARRFATPGILTYLYLYNYLGDGALAGADRELGGGEDWLGARARDVGHRGRHV